MIKFEELDCAKCAGGLIPAIIQDETTRRVLMLGYMNAEAYARTLESGRVTFYSRSKQRLWTKGETSGNFMTVKSIAADCDKDTLLIRVDPAGPVCHTGNQTCFAGSESEGFLLKLQQVVQERHKIMPEDSYTTVLFTKGPKKIAQKVGEEAVETILEAINGTDGDLIYEASDLVYHLLVLLESRGLSLADIEKELLRRHK